MQSLTIISDPNEVFDHCRPILQPVYEALETAVPKAMDILVQNGWPKTSSLFCHLVRAEVKTILQGRKCPIRLDDLSHIVDMHAVGNEGLATSYEGITLRVWRGNSLPKPLTNSKRNFYQHSFPESFWVATAVIPIQSLVVLWSCAADGSELTLSLCCPDGTAKNYKWLQNIPHPSEWMTVLPHDELDRFRDDDFDDLLDEDNEDKKGNG